MGAHVVPDCLPEGMAREVGDPAASLQERTVRGVRRCVGLGNAVCARLQMAGLTCVIVEPAAELPGRRRVATASIRRAPNTMGSCCARSMSSTGDRPRSCIVSPMTTARRPSGRWKNWRGPVPRIYSLLHLVQALARTQGDSNSRADHGGQSHADDVGGDAANCLHAAAVGLLRPCRWNWTGSAAGMSTWMPRSGNMREFIL